LVDGDVAAQLEEGENLLAGDVGVDGQKTVDAIAGFEKIYQISVWTGIRAPSAPSRA